MTKSTKSGNSTKKEASNLGKAGEKVAEVTGFPKMKKGASLWEWIKASVVFLFFKDKGQSMMRETLGEETIKEAKVAIFGLGSGDEKLYLKIKTLFQPKDRSIIGLFEKQMVDSEKDFDRFRCILAEAHKEFLEEPGKNRDNPKKSPSYLVLRGVVSKSQQGFDSQMQFVGESLAKKELGDAFGYKNFGKNPLVIYPAIFVGIFTILVLGFVFFVFLKSLGGL